jgi:peroxiredoxin family protein
LIVLRDSLCIMQLFTMSVALILFAGARAYAADPHSEAFPVFTANLTQLGSSGVYGEISIFVTWWGLVGIGSASGLQVNLTAIPQGGNCSAKNGCGVHVHSGTACTDSQSQGGHYYATAADPWAEIRHSGTNGKGSASFTFSLNIGTDDIDGKPFVVHNNEGGRVACGILSRRKDTLSASLRPLNNSSAVGGVTLFSTPSKIVGAGWGSGLEANISDASNGGIDCSATNGCGAHVHSGSDCGTSQGGHLKTVGGYDPWTAIRYSSTNMSGWTNFMFSIDSDNTETLGKPFIVHDNAGGRVSCGVLIAANVTSTTAMLTATTTVTSSTTPMPIVTAPMTFPVYTASLAALGASGVSGEVSIFVTWWGLVGIGSASGLEVNLSTALQGDNCTAKNGCGVHVHAGTACADSQSQGGHYYATAADPWAEIRHSGTTANGSASFSFSLNIGTEDIDGKPFVVHNNAGGRVACGILSRRRDALSASLHPLSNSSVVGGVTLFSTPSRIVGAGWGSGLEANLSDSSNGGTDCSATNGCGVHVHSGSDCGSSQGGHLKTVGGYDPWTTIRYSSINMSGWASFVFAVESDNTEVLGKPFVMHNNAGGRVSCGVLAEENVASNKTSTVQATTTMTASSSPMMTTTAESTTPPLPPLHDGPYTIYTANFEQLGDSNVFGEVTIFVTSKGLIAAGTALNVERSLLDSSMGGDDCSAANGCGVHVHSGTACTDSTTQGGHYYDKAASSDPWVDIRYPSSDATGLASFSFTVTTNAKAIDGKPFVVHNSAGKRVACGLLSQRSGTSAILNPLDNSGVAGSVTIYSTPSRVFGAGWATGLEASLSDSSTGGNDCTAKNGCGAHVHNGSDCTSKPGQGGHLMTSGGADPWTEIRYSSTDSLGRANFVFSIDSDNTGVQGKPFIVHNSAGGRVACGILSLTGPRPTTIKRSPEGSGRLSNVLLIGSIAAGVLLICMLIAVIACMRGHCAKSFEV